MRFKTLFYLLILIAITSCGTSNKRVFEEFADIDIPSSAIVTNDQYQDMGQDYVKLLEVKLDKNAKAKLESSILKSKFLNLSLYSDSGILGSQLIIIKNKKGLWHRTKNGYSFYGSSNNGKDLITASFDSLTMKAKFKYGAD